MNRLYPFILRKYILLFYFLLLSGTGYTQPVCDCPSVTQCTPCSGSIGSLTLKYTGNLPALVNIFDNGSLIFSVTLSPGWIFTINGGPDGKFDANALSFYTGVIFDASIDVTCSLKFDPKEQHGSFSIISAVSQGGPLCCTSNVGDTVPPAISGCPANIDAFAATQCSASVNWSVPLATDCNLVSFTSTKSPGSLFPMGNTTVIYTATDLNNNKSTCSFNVTVKDIVPPVILNCPAPMTVSADATCTAKVTWTAPAFTDNCAVVTASVSHISGSIFPLGTTEVTYTVKDGSGNTTLCKFNVIVKDQTGPSITGCPTEITVKADQTCQSSVTWTEPVFTDNCSSVTVTSSHEPGDVFPVGQTEVIYTGVDQAGNSSVCKFNVIVNDLVAPVISGCPDDITIITKNPDQVNVVWSPVIATDDCMLSSLTASHESGDLFPVGTTTVTYTANDFSGNIATCTFDVQVVYENTMLDIVQVITPDGNGINDEWVIGNIEKYETNRVAIVDRWGSVVYSATGYDNHSTVWNGRNTNGNVVPTGTYFFTISVELGPSVVEKKGFIELVR